MEKKVGILTLQFANNYGGFLQTYALFTTLRQLGYLPIIINRRFPIPKTIASTYLKLVDNRINSSFNQFRAKHFTATTEPIFTHDAMCQIANNLDAVIVGSDQVWRLEYTKNIGFGYNMFLDFVPKQKKRVSYAASFGTDKFEGDTNDINTVTKLLATFDGISVRENSAVDICQSLFHASATHVLDPTMLLTMEDYDKLISLSEVEGVAESNFLVQYLLDPNANRKVIAKELAVKYNAHLKNIYRDSESEFSLKRDFFPSSKHKFPSFSNWLWSIKNAQFVVTDSFHGVVFSILFNKQFVCIANKSRGVARMDSLLGMFELQSRLIDESDEKSKYDQLPTINYDSVNVLIDMYRKKSVDFIVSSLS